jgi:hypothetical protein
LPLRFRKLLDSLRCIYPDEFNEWISSGVIVMERVSGDVVSCQECACWAKINQRDGSCRRHAPHVSGTIDEVTHWPLTHFDDQCGEAIDAQTSSTHGVACAACVHWRRQPDGLSPYNRRDQPSEWWRHAGHCTRFPPWPSSELGSRAYWRVTHETDSCFDGKSKGRIAANAD